jgi:nucleoid-associated protein YgaU
MENEKTIKKEPRASGSWLAVLGGCTLSVVIICSLVLAVLLMASAAFNVYLAWNLSGYEISVSRATSAPTALVLVTPTGVLAIIPTPTAVPTSTPLPAATTGPTSAFTPVSTNSPTSVLSVSPTQATPEIESPTPTATATQATEAGGSGMETAGTSAGSPMMVAASTSLTAGAATPETIPYVVQEGDTLWVIADRVYGAGLLWEVIFEANRDYLDDPDRIQPGQLLTIPLTP